MLIGEMRQNYLVTNIKIITLLVSLVSDMAIKIYSGPLVTWMQLRTKKVAVPTNETVVAYSQINVSSEDINNLVRQLSSITSLINHHWKYSLFKLFRLASAFVSLSVTDILLVS